MTKLRNHRMNNECCRQWVSTIWWHSLTRSSFIIEQRKSTMLSEDKMMQSSEISMAKNNTLKGEDTADVDVEQHQNNNNNNNACSSLHGLESAMEEKQGGANFTDYLQAQRSLQARKWTDNMIHQHQTEPSEGCLRRKRNSITNNNNENVAETEEDEDEEERNKTKFRLSIIGRRSSMSNTNTNTNKNAANNNNAMADNMAWDRIFHELEAIDEDGHFHDTNEHIIPFYSPPVQRQRWGQDQILPHIDWGCLFFDLFYVAAAYNMGVMLISAMNPYDWPRGIIYFVAIFGSMWTAWESAMYYESRYTMVDYAHRLFDAVRFLFVSVAVLHIKPLELLADPHSAEALLFISAVFLESLMHLGLNVELYFKGQGDRAAIRNHTLVKIKYQLVPTILAYLVALIVAAVQFSQPKTDPTRRFLAEANTSEEPRTRWALTDLPLTLTAIAYLLNIFHTIWRKVNATSGKHGDIRLRFVPNNVDYLIHRYGEWILLMIGESILSLLIVETTESKDYYIITTFGVLTIIILQILKFESEPSRAEDHAMWGNLRNGMSYGYLMQILSMGLIAFGVSYKVFLKAVVKKDADSEYDDDEKHRILAPSVDVSKDAIVALFTGSLSIVLLSLELMMLTHSGIKKAIGHLFKGESNGQRKANWPMVIISVFKAAVLLFALTLGRWTSDPATLTLCGFGIVASLAITRILGWGLIHHKEVVKHVSKRVVKNVNKIKKSISFAPSISSQGKEALESAYGNQPEGDNEMSSDSGIESTRSGVSGADLVNIGIDSSFDAVIVSDLNGIIKQVNTTAVDIFRFSTKEEMIGKNLTILVGGGEGKNHDAYMRGFKKKNHNKSSKVLGQQRMLQAKRADGTEFPCIIGIKTCANDTRIVGYIRDMSAMISDQKAKMTTEIDVSEAVNRVVDDHAFDAIIVCDNYGIIKGANEASLAEFGYASKADLLAENISTLIHGVVAHPELIQQSHGEQRVVTLTRRDDTDFQAIFSVRKIQGSSNMVALYIRNLDSVKHTFKCHKCD